MGGVQLANTRRGKGKKARKAAGKTLQRHEEFQVDPPTLEEEKKKMEKSEGTHRLAS